MLVLWMCLSLFAQVEVNGLTFDGSFETGSLGAVRYDSDLQTYWIQIANDNQNAGLPDSFRRYFHFRVDHVAGLQLKIRFEQVYWHAGNVPLASYDGETWFRIPDSSDEHISLSVPSDRDSVFLAYTFPYGVSRKNAWLSSLIDRPGVQVTSLGLAQVPAPLDPQIGQIEKISLNGSAGQKTFHVWVHARVHPGEVVTSFAVEGLVEAYLDGSDPDLVWLRENVQVDVVPMVNPVGVFLGNYRTNAQSTNLESIWCQAPNPFDGHPVPEVDALKREVDFIQASSLPLDLALNLHCSMEYASQGHFHFKHLVPSVSSAFEALEDRWIEGLDQHATQFNRVNPAASQLSSCAFIESYFWNHYAESVMALTLELTYLTRDSDDQWQEPEDYRQLGREMAHAIAAYFRNQRTLLPLSDDTRLLLLNHQYPNQVEVTAGEESFGFSLDPNQVELLQLGRFQAPNQVIADRTLSLQAWQPAGPSMTVFSPQTAVLSEAVVAHVALAPWQTELVLTNQLDQALNVTLERSQTNVSLPPHEPQRIVLEPGLEWERVRSDSRGFSGSVVYRREPELAATVPLVPESKRILIPHVPADLSRWWLGLVWTNLSDQPQSIRLTGYAREEQTSQTAELVLAPHTKVVQRFDLDFPELAKSAWLLGESDQPIHGVFLFGTQPYAAMAGYPLGNVENRFFQVPMLQGRVSDWQGITLLNSSEQDLQITATLLGSGPNHMRQIHIPPGQTWVSTLETFWPESISGGWLHLAGDRPFSGLSLVGANDFSWIEGFLLQPAENLPRASVPKAGFASER
ncbi:MAG: hypothetical protein H6510_18010 [Acidobacteria bacterium]|nr:hypothetical protein [Acidobacteriota bacterium]MCB9399713.1 hypothetical protein [Acidobacteriota bacterium]